MKKEKKFDAVEFQRKRRNEITKEITGMTPAQIVEYFKRKAKEVQSTIESLQHAKA